VIDCDVHCAPATLEALTPYLSEYWREYTTTAGIRLLGMASAYPPNAPTTGDPAPDSYDALREQVLDPLAPRLVILNCLTLCEAHRNPHYQAALASALNDWLLEEFLERDERLRASLVVSTVDTEDALNEVERLGGDPRFVQVLMPIRADTPFGNRRFHRLYAAAAERAVRTRIAEPLGLDVMEAAEGILRIAATAMCSNTAPAKPLPNFCWRGAGWA